IGDILLRTLDRGRGCNELSWPRPRCGRGRGIARSERPRFKLHHHGSHLRIDWLVQRGREQLGEFCRSVPQLLEMLLLVTKAESSQDRLVGFLYSLPGKPHGLRMVTRATQDFRSGEVALGLLHPRRVAHGLLASPCGMFLTNRTPLPVML